MSLLTRKESRTNLLRLSVRESILLTMDRMRNRRDPDAVRAGQLAFMGVPLEVFGRTMDTYNLQTNLESSSMMQWGEAMKADSEIFRSTVRKIKANMDHQIWNHYYPGLKPEQVVHGLYNTGGGIKSLPAWWRVKSEDVWEMRRDEPIPGEVPVGMSTSRDYGKLKSRVSCGAWVGNKPTILVTDDRDVTDQWAQSYAVALANQTEETLGLVITMTGNSDWNGSVMIESAGGADTGDYLDSCIIGADGYKNKRVVLVENLSQVVEANPSLTGKLVEAAILGEAKGEVGLMMTVKVPEFLAMGKSPNRGIRSLLGMSDIVTGGFTDNIIPMEVAKVCASRARMGSADLGELLLKVEDKQLASITDGTAEIIWQLG